MDNNQLVIEGLPEIKYKTIVDLIPFGATHAVSMRYLANIMGLSERSIRYLIQEARIEGTIICATDSGFFRPTCISETKEYVARTRARIITSVRTLRPALNQLGRDMEIRE